MSCAGLKSGALIQLYRGVVLQLYDRLPVVVVRLLSELNDALRIILIPRFLPIRISKTPKIVHTVRSEC